MLHSCLLKGEARKQWKALKTKVTRNRLGGEECHRALEGLSNQLVIIFCRKVNMWPKGNYCSA